MATCFRFVALKMLLFIETNLKLRGFSLRLVAYFFKARRLYLFTFVLKTNILRIS